MNQYNNPFGGDGKPPEIDLKKLFNNYGSLLIIGIFVLITVVVGFSAYYQVEPDEMGVITRFGKFHKTTEPGPGFRIPLMEEVYKIQAKRQLKTEFGFRTNTAGIKSTFYRDDRSYLESTMLTGDLNVAVVEWIVHYQIQNPKQYLFKVRNVEPTLRALSEATMREVVGDYSVTEVLTSGREEILQRAKEKLSKLCRDYETGLTIQRIELKDSAPPGPVRASFNAVNQAEQERDAIKNTAIAEYNKEIPKARGAAEGLIQTARGYAKNRVNTAQGDVARFIAIQKEYAAAPKVTRTRMYLETMTEVLPKAGKKLIVDEAAKGVVPMLFPLGNRGGVQ